MSGAASRASGDVAEGDMEATEQQRREYFVEPSLGPEREPEIREVLRRLWGYKWLLSAIFIFVVGTAWASGSRSAVSSAW